MGKNGKSKGSGGKGGHGRVAVWMARGNYFSIPSTPTEDIGNRYIHRYSTHGTAVGTVDLAELQDT